MTKAIYTLHLKQAEALSWMGLGPNPLAQVEELLYGGQAGGGKSHVARALGVSLCTIFPGAVVPIFRRKYTELEETHIRSIQREVPKEVAEYQVSRRELRFKNTSVLEFRHCENEQDVFDYQSAEWDGLIIDEATQFTEDMIGFLRSRVRSTKAGWRPFILYTTNPGGLSHNYFKDQFVDAYTHTTPFMAPKDDGGALRMFIPAALDDNPSLSKEQYEKQLEGIKDPDLKRAYKEGDWNIFKGQFFKEWRRAKHVIPWFKPPRNWRTRKVGYDFGVGAPRSCHFYVRDEDLWQHHRIRRWYAYKEFYGPDLADYEQAQFLKEELDREIRDYQKDFEPLPKITIWADPSMWNRKPDKTSIATVFHNYGVPLTKGDNDRIQGWNRVREYMGPQQDGLPGIIYMDNCINAIRTIPALERDRNHPEDLNSDGEDHAADDLRYFIMGISGRERVPLEPREAFEGGQNTNGGSKGGSRSTSIGLAGTLAMNAPLAPVHARRRRRKVWSIRGKI